MLNKSISKGSSLKELSEYFGFSNTKMVSEMIKIYKNLDKELRHLVYFSRQPMYKRGLGYLTFDLARVIASHEINNQKELALTAIDYRFKRVDLEGIRQRMDRSGLSLKEVIEEFKKRQGATTLITT